jgi:hypothetical protein
MISAPNEMWRAVVSTRHIKNILLLDLLSLESSPVARTRLVSGFFYTGQGLPSQVSLPPPPIRTLTPLPPLRTSSLRPPSRKSFPALPLRVSFPSLPV